MILSKLKTIPDYNIHYLLRYITFIEKIRIVPTSEYGENHHILPVSLFPEHRLAGVSPWNQKRIGPREHYICHWLLYKCFQNNKKMTNAFLNMCNFRRGGIRVNSKIYETVKKEHALFVSEWHPTFWTKENKN